MGAASRATYGEQLGMDVGTAQNRLTKMLLFKYGVGDSPCYKCGEHIDQWEEMSIDHITPWRNEVTAIELFFDLDNISFTHKSCNKKDRRNRIEGPVGTAWCHRHRKFFPVTEFNSDAARWNNLSAKCRKCDNAANKKYKERKKSEKSMVL